MFCRKGSSYVDIRDILMALQGLSITHLLRKGSSKVPNPTLVQQIQKLTIKPWVVVETSRLLAPHTQNIKNIYTPVKERIKQGSKSYSGSADPEANY